MTTDDNLRKLIDLAVACGEKRVSAQTDYLHLKYHALQEEIHYPIPTVENFLFALALFRTRSIENITRAKALLEKLLHFQNEKGNFVIYLHEYPDCKDYYTGIYLLAPLYWIMHGYGQILGNELKSKLETVLTKLVRYCLVLAEEKHPPTFVKARIAGGAFAIGKLLGLSDVQKNGEMLIAELKIAPKEFFEPKHLAEFVVASQMWNVNLNESFIPGLLEQLKMTWDTTLSAYIGPALCEYQAGFEPEATLYDLMMGYFTGSFSKRALKDGPFHLQGALIQPFSIENSSSAKDEKYRFAFIDQLQVLNPSQDKGFAPFKLCFGNPDRLHTLVIEGGNSEKVTMVKHDDRLEFLFVLAALPELEDKEKSREVIFYLDLFENTQITIDGIKATTFNLEEKVDVEMDGFKFSLTFELQTGNGQFLGHLMRGNRPSQIANKGALRFAAFDTQIFLRTLRRSEMCILKATLFL